MKAAVRREINNIPAEKFQEALTKLPMHWRKCAQVGGEYFEGCGVVPEFDPYFDQAAETSSESSDEGQN